MTVLNFITTDGKTVLLPKSIWDLPKKSSGLGKSNLKGLDEGSVENSDAWGGCGSVIEELPNVCFPALQELK